MNTNRPWGSKRFVLSNSTYEFRTFSVLNSNGKRKCDIEKPQKTDLIINDMPLQIFKIISFQNELPLCLQSVRCCYNMKYHITDLNSVLLIK